MKPHIMIRYTVADYDKWLEVFESIEDFRLSQGGKTWRIFRNQDQPNNLMILIDWADFEQARAFVKSDEVREAMSAAGVTGPPEFTFLDEVKKHKPGE